MDDACARFFSYVEAEKKYSMHTLLAYRTDLAQFCQVLGAGRGEPLSPGTISKKSIEDFVVWLGDQGYRDSTIARKLAAIRSFLQYLRTSEAWPIEGHSAALRSPPTPRTHPRILSSEELTALLEAPSKRDHPRAKRDEAILRLLAHNGLRAAEVITLNTSDLDLDAQKVVVEGVNARVIPLGDTSASLLVYLKDGRPHLARQAVEVALFLNQRGDRLTRQGLWLVVKRWAAEVELSPEISPHTLRHTLAHAWMSQGRSRREVQRFLGLSSTHAIPYHFTHSSDEETR